MIINGIKAKPFMKGTRQQPKTPPLRDLVKGLLWEDSENS